MHFLMRLRISRRSRRRRIQAKTGVPPTSWICSVAIQIAMPQDHAVTPNGRRRSNLWVGSIYEAGIRHVGNDAGPPRWFLIRALAVGLSPRRPTKPSTGPLSRVASQRGVERFDDGAVWLGQASVSPDWHRRLIQTSCGPQPSRLGYRWPSGYESTAASIPPAPVIHGAVKSRVNRPAAQMIGCR